MSKGEAAPSCPECGNQGAIIDKEKKPCTICTPNPTHDAEVIYDSFDDDNDSYNS